MLRIKNILLSKKKPATFIFVMGFAIVAGFVLIRSYAATFSVSIEPEQGTVAGCTKTITDSTASNSSTVQFCNGATDYNSKILADNPVAFWAMNSTTNTEADLTNNANAGTYKNGTPAQISMPNGDKAVNFNGSNQYLTIPSKNSMSVTTTKELTWEAWIKPSTLTWSTANDPYGYEYVDWMGKCADYSPTCEWEARMYSATAARSSRLSAYIFNASAGLGSGADWQPATNVLQTGHWIHVVGEYQTKTTPTGCNSNYPGGINIWVNGVMWDMSSHAPTGCMSQYQVTPQGSNSPLNIGSMALDTFFPGAVGKVAIYNYQLTQAQISAHYTAMTGLQPSGTCGNTCTASIP